MTRFTTLTTKDNAPVIQFSGLDVLMYNFDESSEVL